MPALFIHGEGDTFILPHHTEELYVASYADGTATVSLPSDISIVHRFAKYSGEKKLTMVEGDHNSPRPDDLKEKIAVFLDNCLLVDDDGDLAPPPAVACEFVSICAGAVWAASEHVSHRAALSVVSCLPWGPGPRTANRSLSPRCHRHISLMKTTNCCNKCSCCRCKSLRRTYRRVRESLSECRVADDRLRHAAEEALRSVSCSMLSRQRSPSETRTATA